MEQSCRSECADFNAAIVNAAADAIVVLDEQHQIRRFNPGAERMFGFRETEVLGKAVALLWSAQEGGGNAVNDLDMHRSEKAAFELTIGHGREFVARRKDGTQFPALVSVGEAQSGKQRVKTCVVRDITEARHTATRHAILVAELEAANRELDSFGYSVSHELRAPLRVLDGFSRMLVESHGGRLDEEGLQLLGAIRANSMKMGNLIRDLLHFSKLGRTSLSVAEIDMNKLVQDALIEVQSSAGVHTRTCSVDVLPVAVCDREMLLHVWVNLLSNAFKFSSKRDQPRVRVSAQSDNAETVYCVSDNGTGFDMRYSGKLFGVFQRLHGGNEYPGTGVGLSIVQRIVSRHGGRVWAESRTGEGATFYFTLPHHSIPMQTLEK